MSKYFGPERRRDERRISIVGYIMCVLISVLVTLVIVQAWLVRREQQGCDRRQPIFREIEEGFREAGKSVPPNSQLGQKLILHANRIEPHIVKNCKKAYPPIIPFIS